MLFINKKIIEAKDVEKVFRWSMDTYSWFRKKGVFSEAEDGKFRENLMELLSKMNKEGFSNQRDSIDHSISDFMAVQYPSKLVKIFTEHSLDLDYKIVEKLINKYIEEGKRYVVLRKAVRANEDIYVKARVESFCSNPIITKDWIKENIDDTNEKAEETKAVCEAIIRLYVEDFTMWRFNLKTYNLDLRQDIYEATI